MRLGHRLLLVSLATLALPWAGCQYVRKVEGALRQGQQDTLMATARLVSAAVAARPELLVDDGNDASLPVGTDLFAHALAAPVVLDGYRADWNLDDDALVALGDAATAGMALRYVAGTRGNFDYLYIETTDDAVRRPASVPIRYRIELWTESGTFTFTPTAPGQVRPDDTADRRILGNWQGTPAGYNLEIRLPRAVAGDRLGFRFVRQSGTGGLTALATADGVPGRLVRRRPALDTAVAAVRPPGVRLFVADRNGFEIAASVSNREAAGDQPSRGGDLLPRFYRFVLGDDIVADSRPRLAPGRRDDPDTQAALAGQPSSSWWQAADSGTALLTAAAPIVVDSGRTVGAVLAEQDSEAILTLTDEALADLIHLTLVATLAAAAALLGFAVWLSWRIRRLRDATEGVLGGDGALDVNLPGAGARDELGDLSRSFSRLLRGLRDYTLYLKTLGSRLNHELRTPLAVVRSSLENLQAGGTPSEEEAWLERARQGVDRLAGMVTALGAATRVEQALATTTDEDVNLAELVSGMAAAYASVHTDRRIDADVPDAAVELRGSPDLLAQMLDKLVENAVDYTPPAGRIQLRLARESGVARVSVANEGSRLPAGAEEQIFDSLVGTRGETEQGPHLGLGLYIVRLIAAHHGGDVAARNLEGDAGVEFVVSLPLTRAAGT